MADNYYDLLGVSRSAAPEEIKKAFRTKAHQHHPDKANGDAVEFKKINEAYQVLSDPAKRQQYDQYGQTFDQARRQGGGPAGNPFSGGFGQSSGFNGNVDFGDLGDIFGDMFGFGGSRTTRRSSRGQDLLATLRISFRTSFFGGQETLHLRRPKSCEHCQGSGAEPGSSQEKCPTCQGSGQVRTVQRTILGDIQSAQECPKCNGEGTIISKPCTRCHGEGRADQVDKVTVKIPAGISTGQKIKLSGQGAAGRRGAPGGDLYINIEVETDKQFRRDDDDLLVEVEIPLSVAVLGGTVEIPTMEKVVTLKIPAGTPSGKVFLIRGQGVPHLRGRGHGDERVTINIAIPSKVSPRAKKLLQDLKEEGL